LIGPYLARSKIGEGGMGVVYLATDPSGRDVAIKVLRANVVGDDEARARMAREVTSLRRVRSSRVAEVYDADPWGETPYLVTRFVSGPSPHDQVQQSGPLTGMQLRDLTVGLA
jgi:serine/threonine protein kinase